MKAPAAEGSVPVPAGIDTETVLSCAETSVRMLHDRNALWNIRVTRRDSGRGALETGDFDDDNIGGFRISVQHGPETGAVRIRLKAAGPHFMDLGAEKAFADLDAQMRQCLSPGVSDAVVMRMPVIDGSGDRRESDCGANGAHATEGTRIT
jgi:hypothetical protein